MAKIASLIPFILHSETGLKAECTNLPPEQMFEIARKTGFAHDPDDSGGATMCGITLATYTAWRTANRHATTTVDDLKNMTYDEWREILRLLFWNRWRADEIKSQAIANALVDWTWTSGKHGITTPQRLLHVKADGIVGERTLGSLNGYADQHGLFDRIQRARQEYHRRIVVLSPNKVKFLKGWQRRVRKITWEGFNYE